MTAPMSTARLEEIRRCYAEEQAEFEAYPRYEPTIEWKEDAVRDLLVEVDRLRALPVLRTCDPCRHWHRPRTFYGYEAARCEKVSPPMPIDVDAPPPATCPLRGGAR